MALLYMPIYFSWFWGLIPFMYLLCLTLLLQKGIWSAISICLYIYIIYIIICVYVWFQLLYIWWNLRFIQSKFFLWVLDPRLPSIQIGCWEILRDKLVQFNPPKSKDYASVLLYQYCIVIFKWKVDACSYYNAKRPIGIIF